MNRPKLIALVLTALVAALVLVLLTVVKVHVDTSVREWPPRHDGEVTLAEADEEMFFDVVTEPGPAREHDPSAAFSPEPESNLTEPAPASGMSADDNGPKGDAPAVTTSKRKSDVKAKAEPAPKNTGPTKEELERAAREEARRRASAATRDAFRRSEGAGNTADKGSRRGNSGSPDGGSSSLNGSGTGSVGGGWIIPRYAQVPSSLTGSIKMTLKIDRNGAVTSVTFTGGNPPAATDAALRRAVEREVRSRRFSRSDGSVAPASATAYITYTVR